MNTTVGIMLNRTYGDGWGVWLNLVHNLTKRGFRDFFNCPFSSLPLGMYVGYFFAYLIFYAFGRHSLNRQNVYLLRPASVYWFVFFLGPASVGLIGAVITTTLETTWWAFFALWYIIGLILGITALHERH